MTLALALAACGGKTELFDSDQAGSGVDPGRRDVPRRDPPKRDDPPPTPPSPPRPPPPPPPTGSPSGVFAHSATTLYELDLVTKDVRTVADFDGCSGVLDIAVDASSRIFASTGSELYLVDPATAKCTFIATGNYPNSLSFVPAGTLLPDREALVGFSRGPGDYVQIDPDTGKVEWVGEIGKGFSSSGDSVSINGQTFVSVVGPGCTVNDCLVEVDPKNGAALKNWGSLGRIGVYGLAAAGGVLYGFAETGDVIEITFAGDTIKTTPLRTSGAVPFYGAGSLSK